MKGFEQGTLGHELIARELTPEDLEKIKRISRKSLLKKLDYDLRHGEDIMESISDIEAERELDDSGIYQRPDQPKHAEYHIPHPHPEEQVQHDYDGDTPQDPEFWEE